MLTNLATGLVSLLRNALTVVVLFAVLVFLVRWGRANPDDMDRVGTSVMNAGAAVVIWACNGVSSMLAG
jgi:hypothetical protein